MIRFTDPQLYVKGTCAVQLANTKNGNIEYWSNKVQNFNENSNANEDIIRAGLGNGIATVLISDCEKTVTATVADFSLKAKAMQLGGTVQYNGIAPVCQNVTAEGGALSVDVSGGAPVANYGFTKPLCYVQKVGANSPISQYGAAYEIDPTTGAVSGFAAEAGVTYKVWYFVRKASALEAAFYSTFQPGVYHATFQLAVFRNMTGADTKSGTRVGWLYCIYPRYKLTPGGGMVGDQNTADTTDLSGRAMSVDSDVIGEACTDCEVGTTCYYLYVPDDGSDAVTGILTQLGGVITVDAGATYQIKPNFVMENGQIVPAGNVDGFTFSLAKAPSGTSVSNSGLITAGSTAGETQMNVTYTDGYKVLKDSCTVAVVSM